MVDFYNRNIPENKADWMRLMTSQLERTEQASISQQQAFQNKALLDLASHSIETVPAYKNRLKCLVKHDGSLDISRWQDIPILNRQEVIALGSDLVSTQVPKDHLPVEVSHTSGSTGTPLEFQKTRLCSLMAACISHRYHRWHNIDYGLTLCSILSRDRNIAVWPDGETRTGWAPAFPDTSNAGFYHTLNISTPVEQQVEWLRRMKPDYLHSLPGNLRAIALFLEEDNGEKLNLSEVLSYGEMLLDDTREIIKQAFGCNPRDCYSSRECGYMALQSPSSNNYLVQSEVCLVEILNEQGEFCKSGETGSVVISAFHEYAQPLIRYAIGDLAVVGESDVSGLPCPVLSKIYGRSRNMFRLSGGRVLQPDFNTVNFIKYLKPKQWQVAQISLSKLEVRIVPSIDPSEMNTKGMTKYIRDLLGDNLTIEYKLVPELQNPVTGKHEDYICELS